MTSCLFQTINFIIISTIKKHLIVSSDNYDGQLKKRLVVGLYKFVGALGLFDTIEFNFLITGHSLFSEDTHFDRIEGEQKFRGSNLLKSFDNP